MHPHNVKNQISMWKRDINLIYMSGYIEHFEAGNVIFYCFI